MKKELIAITAAARADLPEILQLQYLAYRSEAELLGNFDIPPLRQTLSELTAEFEHGTVLKAADTAQTIIGSVRFTVRDGNVLIGKLMVHPDHRGRGLGTRLLACAEELCPGMRLELFTSSRSLRNLALYERCGFRQFDQKNVGPGLTLIYLEKLRNCIGEQNK